MIMTPFGVELMGVEISFQKPQQADNAVRSCSHLFSRMSIPVFCRISTSN
jgi:hypothetical protein